MQCNPTQEGYGDNVSQKRVNIINNLDAAKYTRHITWLGALHNKERGTDMHHDKCIE